MQKVYIILNGIHLFIHLKIAHIIMFNEWYNYICLCGDLTTQPTLPPNVMTVQPSNVLHNLQPFDVEKLHWANYCGLYSPKCTDCFALSHLISFSFDSMVLFLVLAHWCILCELATIYPMWFCLISSQGLLSIYTPWLPLWHVVTQHLEYSIRVNKEYSSIYQTTIYMYGGTGLEYHPWGFGGVLNCSPGTYKLMFCH